ncbi:MAG: four helix bundle protein [Gemmatimonas sp.]
MRNPKTLAVLPRANALVLSLYRSPLRASGKLAPGLSAQLLRSVSSIPWNIAEGAALADPGFVRHLTIAIASANEAEQQIELAHELDVLGADGDWHLTEIVEIRKMMIGQRKSVLRKREPGKRTRGQEG